MKNDPSEFSAADLVSRIQSAGEEDDRDFRYRAGRYLIGRWRQGIDLDPLINLLNSEKSRDRLLGAYYLCELGDPVEDLKIPVLQLADDSISYCRRAFVEFIGSARYYDEPIGIALAECLLDLDLYVRVSVLRWGIAASAEQFELFSRVVEAGAGRRVPRFPNPLSNDYWNESELKRGIRGLNIVRRIRAGEEVSQIRSEFPEEDNFVLDSINFLRTIRQRESAWREMKRRRADS
ncbi:hypothetical protein AB4Z01_15715 [Inquilinus sp. YAF38]|uniref:hypothetical protein n=1 Tax=Inquilinus sp. YAF38 TaxID=3233084 RepID=UPI003F907456